MKNCINKKVYLLCISFLVSAFCCLSLPFHVKAESGPASLSSPEEAEDFIRTMFSEDAASLNGKYLMTEAMENAVSSSGGMEGLSKVLVKQLGEPESIGPSYMEETARGTFYHVPCRFKIMPLDLVFTMDDGAIAGLITAQYTGENQADAAENENAAFESIELSVPVPALNGELPGTLTVPEGEGPFPAVVLVHGSGPNDRNETLMQLTPFKDLAEGLAAHGVAVFRYDKRSYVYGAEMASDHQTTLEEETIEDAVSAVQLLADQDRIDSSRIFVLGHSLGAMAVPAIDEMIQTASVKPCGYILMAPGARRLDITMREQYEFLYSLMPEVTEEQLEEKSRIFSELDRLEDPEALSDEDQIAGAYAPYWKWLLDYDILGTAKNISVPCLVLQGEEDYQVTMEDFGLWQDAVGDKENWTLISYPGLTHVFITGQKSDGASAYSKDERMSEEVIDDIAGFINR